jgi:hypothetical protein
VAENAAVGGGYERKAVVDEKKCKGCKNIIKHIPICICSDKRSLKYCAYPPSNTEYSMNCSHGKYLFKQGRQMVSRKKKIRHHRKGRGQRMYTFFG